MLFIKLYSFLFIIFLFVPSETTISQSKKNINSISNTVVYIQDSNVEYKVSAYFVDRALKAQSAVQTYGRSLELIMKNLDRLRNGLGIIIEKVWIVRKNKKEELLQNVPPEFMRETDSLLARHWAEQYHKNK